MNKMARDFIDDGIEIGLFKSKNEAINLAMALLINYFREIGKQVNDEHGQQDVLGAEGR